MKKLNVNIKQWIKAFLLALGTVVFVKSFLFWVYLVPSTSMEKTLLPGDLILVNKWEYGLRLPITPLTFPLSHQKLPFYSGAKSYLAFIQFPYVRLFSSTIERNDVVVFNYPMETEYPIDHRSFFIKRCIGLPGDTLEINAKKVSINNTDIPYPEAVTFDYHVESDVELSIDTLKKYGITQGGRVSGKNRWQLTLSDSIVTLLKSRAYIKSIQPLNIEEGNYADYIFPYSENYKWNVDHFGKLVIPKKGVTVKLTLENIHLYRRLIVYYEGHVINWKDGTFILDGKPITAYTFELDYYFVMGDNRHNSSDSRFWGFVPQSHIVGKATSVLFSINKDHDAESKFRWERFFMKID